MISRPLLVVEQLNSLQLFTFCGVFIVRCSRWRQVYSAKHRKSLEESSNDVNVLNVQIIDNKLKNL